MFIPQRRTRRLVSWLSTMAGILAIVSQLALVLGPLAEGREGVSAVAHVDAAGTTAHHAHSEASCVACQTRSLHAAASAAAPPAPPAPARPLALRHAADRLPPGEAAPHTYSRAPPRLS